MTLAVTLASSEGGHAAGVIVLFALAALVLGGKKK